MTHLRPAILLTAFFVVLTGLLFPGVIWALGCELSLSCACAYGLFLLIRQKWRPNAERPDIPYGVAIALGGLWVIANGLLTTSAA